MAAALFACFFSYAFADHGGQIQFDTKKDPNAVKPVEPAATTPDGPNPQNQTAKKEEKKKEDNGPSLLREYLHKTTFDAAADATREVENTHTPRLGANECERLATEKAQLTGPSRQKYIQECNAAYERAKFSTENMKGEAAKVRKQQELFGDISRVSDVVAVGAVGATAVSQLAMKDDSQSKSLEKVSKIQKTAGYAAYASGATDLTLGATAYLHQKKKLEKLKEGLEQEVASEGQIITAKTTGSSISNLETAIKKTKEAAYKHLLVGAGKVATGFVSMKLSESNKKEAEKLKSLEPVQPVQPMTAPIVGGGGAVTYTNNNPGFFAPNSSGSSSSPSVGSGSGGIGSGGGTSVMPSSGTLPLGRNLAGMPSSASGGVSGGGGGDSKKPGGATPPAKESEEKKDKTAETLGDAFELNLTGGASRYGGGSREGGGEDPAAGMAALFSGLLGTGEGSSATDDSTGAYTGEGDAFVQGASESGVNAGESSLFEIVKTKHNKMMQAGRLTGPGEVVTR